MGRNRSSVFLGRSVIVLSLAAARPAAAEVAVEADVASLDASEQYIALILDYDNQVQDNLFIKLIVDPATGQFAAGQFAHGRNEGPWEGMSGGISFFFFDEPFSTAHFKVRRLDSGTVVVELTNLDGNPNRSHSERRGGWIIPNRKEVGFGGDGGKVALDNFAPPGGGVCDMFERDNGDIGRLWRVEAGEATTQGQTARGDGHAFAIWVSEDCNACSGVEKLAAKCVEKTSGNVLIAKITRGLPGGLVQFFDQNSGEGEEKVINNRGKAKKKFTDAESGLHFVFASFTCGYTLEARPTCP